MDPFESSSDDAIRLIIRWLPLLDALSLGATCRRLRSVVSTSGLQLLDDTYLAGCSHENNDGAAAEPRGFWAQGRGVAKCRRLEAAMHGLVGAGHDPATISGGHFSRGTARQLVEHLTSAGATDSAAAAEDAATAVMTWAAFARGETIAAALCRRYHDAARRGEPRAMEAVVDLATALIAPRENVALRALGEDAAAMERIAVLAEYCVARKSPKESLEKIRRAARMAAGLAAGHQRRSDLLRASSEPGSVLFASDGGPPSAAPADPALLCLWWRRFPPQVVARAMTAYEQRILFRVGPRELVRAEWRGSSVRRGGGGTAGNHLAPNITALLWRFNGLCQAVAADILTFPEASDRARAIERAVVIARELRAVNNYQQLAAIVCALGSASIQRLRTSWGLVAPEFAIEYAEYQRLCAVDDEYRTIRAAALASQPAPCIPYLGVFLLTLAHLHNAHPSGEFITFYKWRLCAESVAELLRFLSIPYGFEVVLDAEASSSLDDLTAIVPDPATLFAISLQREPRQQ